MQNDMRKQFEKYTDPEQFARIKDMESVSAYSLTQTSHICDTLLQLLHP